MNNIETGNNKIKKICDVLKNQTLEPAKIKATEIIERAKIEAQKIKNMAEKETSELLEETKKEMENQKNLCASAIKSASKQVIDKLKKEIEDHFFNKNLHEIITKITSSVDVIKDLIKVLVKTIEKEGTDVDFSVIIPNEKVKEINDLLTKDILEKLKEKKVLEGNFSGGIKVKLHDKQITIDISDETLTGLIIEYIRKDFRKLIFNL